MSVAPESSVDPIEHLVSLNWDHPLPSAVVALTLVLEQLPVSDCVDVTGGTKVLSTRVLLRHARERDLTTATYVDGRHNLLRCLAPNGPAGELPGDVRLEEILELRGGALRCNHVPSTTTVSSRQLLAARDEQEAMSAIAELIAVALGDAGEVLMDVRMTELASSREDRADLLVRQGHAVSLIDIAWSTSPGDVLHAAWPQLLIAADALGDYARVVFVTKLGDDQQRRVERRLRRRSAGAAPACVLGRSALERKSGHEIDDILEAAGAAPRTNSSRRVRKPIPCIGELRQHPDAEHAASGSAWSRRDCGPRRRCAVDQA